MLNYHKIIWGSRHWQSGKGLANHHPRLNFWAEELDSQPHCEAEASRGIFEHLKRNGNQPCCLSLLALVLCLQLALDVLN